MAKSRSTPPSAPLFESAQIADDASRPLADRLRPKTLGEVIGQDHLLGEGGPLRRIADGEAPRSMIFWGPPGTGKTTVARLMASRAGLHFEQLSAIFSGVQDLRKVFEEARDRRRFGQGTILFVDEIHRFNRSQQELLPALCRGRHHRSDRRHDREPVLRAERRAFVAHKGAGVQAPDRRAVLSCCLSAPKSVTGRKLPLTPEARQALLGMADGDGRTALNLAEDVYDAMREGEPPVDAEKLVSLVQRRAPLYDKNRDGHYDLISALHKSVRGSDPDAALYWFCRMIDGGEAPLYLARRLVRMAVEDIGLADPQALVLANAAKDAYDFLGSPEGELALAQCVVYLAAAPKSNSAYAAYGAAMRLAKEGGSLAPPKHILNAPTKLMRSEGYGAGYVYDHSTEEGVSGQNYFPDGLGRQQFYRPGGRGYEPEIKARLEAWGEIRRKAAGRQDAGS